MITTKNWYVRAVALLAQFYHTSPGQLSAEQVRQYLLHLSTVQEVAHGTHTIALCGITFFHPTRETGAPSLKSKGKRLSASHRRIGMRKCVSQS